MSRTLFVPPAPAILSFPSWNAPHPAGGQLAPFGSGQYRFWARPGSFTFVWPAPRARIRVVGAGASGGLYNSSNQFVNGGPGGTTSVGVLISATGGQAGQAAASAGNLSGGAGGTGTGGSVNQSGGRGGDISTSNSSLTMTGGGAAGSQLGPGGRGGDISSPSGQSYTGGGGAGEGAGGDVLSGTSGWSGGGSPWGSATSGRSNARSAGAPSLLGSMIDRVAPVNEMNYLETAALFPRFPGDLLSGHGGFGVPSGGYGDWSRAGPGGGGGGIDTSSSTSQSQAFQQAGHFGGSGAAGRNMIFGNQGFLPGLGGGGGARNNSDHNGTGNFRATGGGGGGFAMGEFDVTAGATVALTVGLGGMLGAANGGPGLIVIEW